MWGALLTAGAQLATNLIGQRRGKRAGKRATEDTKRAANQARGKGFKAGDDARRSLNRQIDERTDRAADRAEGRVASQAREFLRLADGLHRQTERRAERAAGKERKQVREDEATRFSRLRAAAEAGGFNPLTVLEAGFLGASLPTGFLSADQQISLGSMRADSLTAGHSTRMSLDGQIQGQRINSAIEGVTAAASIGLATRQAVFDEIMTGHELAAQSGQAAHEQTASGWRDIGNVAVSALDAHRRAVEADRLFGLDQDRLGLDRDRLELDRGQLAYERDYNERVFQANQAAARSPGFGGSRYGSVSGAVLGDDPRSPVSINGLDFGFNANTSPEEVHALAYGGTLGEISYGATQIPQWADAMNETLFYGPLRAYRDAFVNRESVAGKVWGAARDLWSSPAVTNWNFSTPRRPDDGGTWFRP